MITFHLSIKCILQKFSCWYSPVFNIHLCNIQITFKYLNNFQHLALYYISSKSLNLKMNYAEQVTVCEENMGGLLVDNSDIMAMLMIIII